jgi:4-amino-4-deoxy-L-arabinose transferase-like glycosyltransferase
MARDASKERYEPVSRTPTGFLRTRYGVAAVAVFLLSLSLGLAWLAEARTQPFSDYQQYLQLAEGVLDHHQFGYPEPSAERLPGYPIFLAMLLSLSRSVVWLSICNVLLAALLAVVVFYLTLALTAGNMKAAGIAAFLCAVNPTFVFYSPVLASEHLFVLLLFSALLVAVLMPFRPVVTVIISGFVMGYAMLTRGEAVFYLPVVMMAVMNRRARMRDKIALSICCLSVCFAVVFPWHLRNLRHFGPAGKISSTVGINFYLGHNDRQYGQLPETDFKGSNAAERQEEAFRQGAEYLRANPLRLLSDMAKGTKGLYFSESFYALRDALVGKYQEGSVTYEVRKKVPSGARRLVSTFYLALLALAAASLAFCRKHMTRPSIVIGVIVMNWVCYAVVFFAKARYRFAVEVVFCILAGIALYSAFTGISAMVRRRRSIAASHG